MKDYIYLDLDLDEETMHILNAYCMQYEITKDEAIKQIISNSYNEKNKKDSEQGLFLLNKNILHDITRKYLFARTNMI